MFVVPVMGYLLIVFVELWSILSVLAIPLSTVLCDENTSAQKQGKRGRYNLEG
jgi:hypothetical protein